MPDTKTAVTDKYGHEHIVPGPFRSVAEIKRANKAAGRFFFSPDTMRFFNSRVESGVIGGRLFVTSEQFEDSRGERPYPREYKVRVAADDGDVNNLTDDTYIDADDAEQAALAAIAR